MTFKKIASLALVSAAAMLCASQAEASVQAYSITTSGSWFDSGGTPLGLPLSPTLSGSITVDNSLSGISAMTAFSLTTGTKTWTLADFVGSFAQSLSFDGLGNLTGFSLHAFQSGSASMYIYSNNTMAVNDGLGSFNACNGCVRLGAGMPVTSAVPEPTNVALVLAGLGVVGWTTRRRAKALAA
jgi:hypothetical protein